MRVTVMHAVLTIDSVAGAQRGNFGEKMARRELVPVLASILAIVIYDHVLSFCVQLRDLAPRGPHARQGEKSSAVVYHES